MDDKTLQALTALANKLGTTAEYLWGVLLKQAPITGTIDLLMLIAVTAGTVYWCHLVYRKTRQSKTNEFERNYAEWDGDKAVFGAQTAAMAAFLTVLLVSRNLTTTLSALLNPEYWALMQVLK